MAISEIGSSYNQIGAAANYVQEKTTVKDTDRKMAEQPVSISISNEGKEYYRNSIQQSGQESYDAVLQRREQLKNEKISRRKTSAAGERASGSHVGGKIESEAKSGANRDTVSISVAGQQFFAENMESSTDMELIHIGSDLDEFRNAVRSMNEKLPVSWKAMVDPYNTITNLAKIESRLKQLADPTVSHNDEDMEKVAEAYAKEKIDALIEKKKAMIADGTVKTAAEEYEEYKTAYDAYHSENGSSLIAKMTGDIKKAYDIYKNIIDGTKISINDEEFLIFHNCTMYRAAKAEYIRKNEELYNAMNGVPIK